VGASGSDVVTTRRDVQYERQLKSGLPLAADFAVLTP
jgi:hypothetical protein